MGSDDVVFGIRATLLVQSKMQPEAVLAVEALVIPIVELLQDKNQRGFLGHLDVELLVPLRLPWHLDADPALTASPFGISEEASSVEMLVFLQQVFICDPEN